MLPRGVQHMRASGSFGRFTLFSPLFSPSNDTCRWSFVLVFCLFVCLGVVFCRGFVSCFASVMEFLKSSARISPR